MVINKDKWYHFIICFLITFIFAIIFNLFISVPISIILGIILSLFIGIGKEIYDKYSPNHYFDWKDILADLLGSIFGGIISIIVL